LGKKVEKNKCIIIDPACYNKQEQDYLIKFLNENNLKPVKLLNTHCHLDHVFGNKFISDTFKLSAEAHVGEDSNIYNALNAASIYGNLVFLNWIFYMCQDIQQGV